MMKFKLRSSVILLHADLVHHFSVSSPIFLSTGRTLPWQASFKYHTDMVKIAVYTEEMLGVHRGGV